MIKGVLLDIDGTLVLSNDAHARSWAEAFEKFGYTVYFDKVRQLIGMGGDKLVPELVPSLNSESGKGKEIVEYRSEIFLDRYVSQLQPASGSRELIKKLRQAGLKLMVASSAKSHELETLLKAARVNDLLEEATTSDDADRSKPDPDIVQAALEKIKLPAEKVIMIGDTPYDIEAAGRTGVGVIAVRCGGWSDKDLSGAIDIYNDPADILSNFDKALQ